MINIEKLNFELNKLLNHFKAAKFNYVIENGKRMLTKYPFSSGLQNLVGSSYQQIGEVENAKKSFKAAIKLDTNNIAAINNLGNIYKLQKEYNKSKELYETALKKNNKYINALINYGTLEVEFNRHENGINLINKGLEIKEKNPYAYYNLGIAYSQIGDFEKAIANFKKTLNIDPLFTEADQKISLITKYDKKNKHLLEMKEKIKNKDLNINKKVTLYYAFGKALEDIGENEESIKYIREANRIKSNLIKFNIKKEINLFENIIDTFDKIDLQNVKKKNSNKKFIFIVGMPRSGTSLLEQIISSHSEVYGAGELPFLKMEINKKFNFYEYNNINVLNNKDNLNEIFNKYVYYMNFYERKEKYIIDKLPLNLLWIGFIRLLFPDSKVIYTKRNAEDVCISCYKNYFEHALKWTNNVSNIAKIYNEHDKLMKFWKSKINNFIYTAEYEEIVSNFDIKLKEILEFCDLPYEKKCLEFYKSKSIVKTLSVGQVRSPIYKTSINKYKNYKDEIDQIRSLI